MLLPPTDTSAVAPNDALNWTKHNLPRHEEPKFIAVQQTPDQNTEPFLWFEKFFEDKIIQYLCNQTSYMHRTGAGLATEWES